MMSSADGADRESIASSLPQLPRGYFFRVEDSWFTNSGFWEMQIRKRVLFYSVKVSATSHRAATTPVTRDNVVAAASTTMLLWRTPPAPPRLRGDYNR